MAGVRPDTAPATSRPVAGAVDLYWLPLGAGGHLVRWNGRAYEWLCARRERRAAADLYHAALAVRSEGMRVIIEMAPVWNLPDKDRGAILEGPVGATWLGRLRIFRYEVRCWPNGRIPDIGHALGGPLRVSSTEVQAASVLDRVRHAPPLTWGRDQLRCGEMWNSNSLVAWLLAGTGHDTSAIRPPAGGRAPGWQAGLCLAARTGVA